jgi:hypothetical protein
MLEKADVKSIPNDERQMSKETQKTKSKNANGAILSF